MSTEKKLVYRFTHLGLGMYSTSPKSKHEPQPYSPRRSTVKRNLNSSFGAESPPKSLRPRRKSVAVQRYVDPDFVLSPVKTRPRRSVAVKNYNEKLMENLTLVINKETNTCHWKNPPVPASLSEDDSDDDCRIIFSPPKTSKRKTTNQTEDDSVSPTKGSKITHEQKYVTPRKDKIQAYREFYAGNKTPKTPKNTPQVTKTPSAAATPKTTPRNALKLFKEGVITPKMQTRDRFLQLETTPLKQARTQLHVSYVPADLPCREKEYSDILSFLEGKLADKCGGCMYISGVPGTGKTATVTSVINYLVSMAKAGEIPQFKSINLNGMKLTEPRQAYVEIWKQLNGKAVTWEQAQNALEAEFTKKSKKPKMPIILLVDELDIICTKRQDVVYNLLDWPTKSTAHLIVITIANTMDLPERLLMNRVTSRLGLTRLPFQPYTYKQLQEIVSKRLVGTNSFNPEAVELVARKVASVSGDARRALDICRRAAENAEIEGDDTLVTMAHVNEALKAMVTQPKVRAVKNCSKLEQYILQSVIAEVERTGIEETVFHNVFKMLASLSSINGFKAVSSTLALRAVAKLSACRLLLTDQKCNDLDQKIILNVSSDDVYFALKEE